MTSLNSKLARLGTSLKNVSFRMTTTPNKLQRIINHVDKTKQQLQTDCTYAKERVEQTQQCISQAQVALTQLQTLDDKSTKEEKKKVSTAQASKQPANGKPAD